MTARVEVGDVVAWARAYDGPPLFGLSFRALEFSVRPAVAWLAERDEVIQVIRVKVAGKESEGDNVMDLRTRFAAMLTRERVPLAGGSPLRLPVLPMPSDTATVDKLRMKHPNAILVTTGTCTESATASALGPTRPSLKFDTAPLARERYSRAPTGRVVRVLAGARTMASAAMRRSARRPFELISAPLTGKGFHTIQYRQLMGQVQH